MVPSPLGALALAALRGREDEVTRLVRTSTQDLLARGEGMGLTVSHWVTAALYNGLARYEDAFAAVELIEAASRSVKASQPHKPCAVARIQPRQRHPVGTGRRSALAGPSS